MGYSHFLDHILSVLWKIQRSNMKVMGLFKVICYHLNYLNGEIHHLGVASSKSKKWMIYLSNMISIPSGNLTWWKMTHVLK